MACGELRFVVEEEEGDVVLLADGGLVGVGGELCEEVVDELAGGDGVVRVDVLHETIESELHFCGVGSLRDAIGVEDMAIAGLERELECGVFGFVDSAKNETALDG